jgi:hypothetical protein
MPFAVERQGNNQATINYTHHLLGGHVACLQDMGEVEGFHAETRHFVASLDDLLALPCSYSEGCLVGLDVSVN